MVAILEVSKRPRETAVCNEVTAMENFYGRCVFFVRDAERSLEFYTKTLGFSLNWNHQEEGRTFVFEVSLFGFQLILNQAVGSNELRRAGCGRVFVGLEDDQLEPFRKHVKDNNIQTTLVRWGAATLAINDVDENELFFWLPPSEREKLESELAKLESEAARAEQIVAADRPKTGSA